MGHLEYNIALLSFQIRAMYDDGGKLIDKAGPSNAVQVFPFLYFPRSFYHDPF